MTTSYRDIVIYKELADRLQQVFHLNAAPRTLDDLSLPASVNLGPFTDGIVTRLHSVTPTRHQVCIGGETVYTYCVMDAFMLPVLQNVTAEIDSPDPDTGDEIRLQVTPRGIAENGTALTEAVVSFGVSREGDGSVYSAACPFINLFASRINYDRWAQAHPEALTIAIPLVDAVALARAWACAGGACC
jgi:Alkylmercury lyase